MNVKKRHNFPARYLQGVQLKEGTSHLNGFYSQGINIFWRKFHLFGTSNGRVVSKQSSFMFNRNINGMVFTIRYWNA